MIFTADKLKQARDAGYSDDEIWGFVSQQDNRFNQAKEAGYSLDEVSGFFSQKEQPAEQPITQPTVAGISVPPAPEPLKVETPKPEEGILRKAADIPIGLLAGTAGTLKSVADVFGADSPASQQFADRERFWNNLISESGKEKQKRAAEIQQAAQDKGVWEQAKAAAKAFTEAPTIMLATGAGSLAPIIATGGAVSALGGGATAVTGTQVGLGTLMGAGSVKGGIYEQVKQNALDAGKTPEEAEKIASEAQSYGENPEQIIAGGALGALASATGIEATAGRAISGAARKLATGAQIVGKNVAEEVLTEVPQQFQQRVSQNIASQKAGFNVPTFQGAIGEATTAGIIAAGLGGVAGGIDAVAASSENAQKVKMAVNTQSAAQQTSEITPLTSSVVIDQAEAVGRQAATDLQTEADQKITETPEQRVARLQQEAKAAAGITLEEEAALPAKPEAVPTPEIAQAAKARITEREGKAATPVETPAGTRIEAAAYQAPDGTVYYGASHLDAMAKARDAGKIDQAAIDAKQEVTSRETPEFGFSTDKEAFIGRSQAEVVATGSGQMLVDKPATGLLHSNEVSLDAFAQPVAPEAAPAAVEQTPVTPTPRITLAETAADVETVDATVSEVRKLGEVNPLNERQIVANGVRVEVERQGPNLNIKDIYSPEQGLGRGTEVLQNILKIADQNEVSVVVTPQPTGTTTEEQLRKWYSDNGFVEHTQGRMIRRPVTPPPATPQLEPLRRVARAEQTEEDVAGLVDSGFVELYKGQPVLTQAGLDALPEAERPRLTPEARKIQIDTRTSEAAAEATSKNLRIGVDQVPADVRMPAGWTLVGDVYVPPTITYSPEATPLPRESAVKGLGLAVATPEVREARREPAITPQQYQPFDQSILTRSADFARGIRGGVAGGVGSTEGDIISRSSESQQRAFIANRYRLNELLDDRGAFQRNVVVRRKEGNRVLAEERYLEISDENNQPLAYVRNGRLGVGGGVRAPSDIQFVAPNVTVEIVSERVAESRVETPSPIENIFDAREGIGQVPFNVEIGYRGFVKYMTPSEFRSLVPAGVSGPETKQFVVEALGRGEKLGQPFLNVEWNEDDGVWEVTDHEGRSRVDAILEVYGNVPIPVHIFPRQLRAADITDQMRNASFISQADRQRWKFDVTKPYVRPVSIQTPQEVSEITPQQDRDYLDAVERGDLDAASRMVDEAAKKAGYDIRGYHGTRSPAGFTEFIPNEALGGAIFIATEPSEAAAFGRVMDVFLKAENVRKGIVRSYDEVRAIAAAKKRGQDAIRVTDGLNAPVNYAVFDPSQIKSADPVTYDDQGNIIPLSQRFQPEQADIRYSYAGVQAQTPQFMRDSLSVAQAMAAKGEDAEAIRSVTGWIVNPYDGKLRWEIPDNDARFVSSSVFANAANAIAGGDTMEQFVGKLGDILDHKPLFDAYPDLKNVEIFMANLVGTDAEFRKGSNIIPSAIVVSYRANPSGVKSLILHEIQHWIQEKEGFSTGTNPQAFLSAPEIYKKWLGRRELMDLSKELGVSPVEAAEQYRGLDEYEDRKADARLGQQDPDMLTDETINRNLKYWRNRGKTDMFTAYERTAGEIESRDVQARMKMTPEQRKATAPYSSENISPEDAVIMGGEGGVAALRGRRIQMGRVGMETSAVEARLQELGFPTGGIIRVVNQPDADFEGRTIILDGKVTGIELNASALKDNAAIDRVLNHEFAESANADGALNKLVKRLTPKEKKEINDTITRLRYEERARTAEEAARAIETLAEAWKGRGFFTRAVARIEAWASKLGFKLTRRAAEYIAARNLADINSGFRTAYNRFINVKGEAREGRAFVTPEENARFLELAKDPEANREELQKMVDKAAKSAGFTIKTYHGTSQKWNNPNGNVWASNKKIASTYGDTIMPFRIKLENPLIIDANYDTWSDIEFRGEIGWTTDEIANVAKSEGFDGAIINNLIDSSGTLFSDDAAPATIYVAFNAESLKSAEPVTYDDQGNVIPLEQRFQPATPDIRYARREVRESRREPEAIPTFTEGTPEAATLKEMAASMAKVDAASEAKGGKPETYRISEIASVWMDSGLGERELQDAIVEYTNLTPANAQKVARAIAKQYGIQQQLAQAVTETPEGISVEGIPEGATVPVEADPKRPKTTLQRVIDAITGVRAPIVKITGNEKTLLKEQIKLKAAATRAAKKAQQEMAADVVEAIKAMDIRGGIRPKQASALMKRAALINFASEKSVDRFINYAEKVISNANYDKDLADARLAQKRAKELAKSERVPSNQQDVLNGIANIEVGFLDDPREFAEAANHYMRAFKSVVSEDYVVVPDNEMTSYLSEKEDEAGAARSDFDLESITALAEKWGVKVSDVNNIINAQDTEAALAQYANREVYEGLLSEKAKQSIDALRKYDVAGMTQSQQSMVAKAVDLDVEALEQQDKVDLVRRIDNILVNGRTNGFQKYVDIAEAQSNALKAARDNTFTGQMAAWINILTGKAIGKDITLVGKKQQKELALTMQSVADTFRNIFGKKQLGKAQQIIGHFDLIKATNAANNAVDSAGDQMEEFYGKQYKKYGKALSAPDTIMAEGIAGYLIQSVPYKSEGDSIAQRRRLIQEDIRVRRATGDEDMIESADMIEEQLAKVDGDSVKDILSNLKSSHPAAYESLIWLKDTLLPQYKEFLKAHDENYNDQTNNYENPNYLPIKYKFVNLVDLSPDAAKQYAKLDSLTPKQAANTIKRVDYSVLPKGANIDYSIRKNAFNSLAEQLRKAHTASAWTKIDAFLKSKDAAKVFGGGVNVKFMSDRLKLLKDSQERRSYEWRGDAKFFDSLATISRKFGIGYALGGIYQVFKQFPDQLMTTIANTGRYDLQAENLGIMMFQPKTSGAMKMLSKFPVGRRGDAAMGGSKFVNAMESNYTNLERYFSGGQWAAFKERAQKVNDIWLAALKKSDYVAAASGWMTYYQSYLAQNGIKFTDWNQESDLVDTDKVRQEAAAYAESMIDIYQGSSDPTNMATFAQRGKGGYENIFKAIFMPLNSFALQQRSRMISDARDALTKSSDPEKRSAGIRGLASTIGGMTLFHLTRRYFLPAVSGLGAATIYALLGIDPEEPDEEKKKEMADFRWRQFMSELSSNLFVGGFGSLPEQKFIDALNRAAYFGAEQVDSPDLYNDKGEKMAYSTWLKEKSPFWRYREYGTGMNMGMLDITSNQIGQVAEVTRKLNDPELMDTLTNEEKRLIYFAALSEWLYTLRLNDTDMNRMMRNMAKETEAVAKEREKVLKAIREVR